MLLLQGKGRKKQFSTAPQPYVYACALTHLQLIKKLSATPTLLAQNDLHRPAGVIDSQAALQANKATFFFQLVSQHAAPPGSEYMLR